MLRTKLITLVSIAVLAMGVSSKATADPIIDATYDEVIVGEDALGNLIVDLLIGITYNDTCQLTSSCNAVDNGLWGIDVFLDVQSIGSLDALAGWTGEIFDYIAFYLTDDFYGDVPPVAYSLGIRAANYFGLFMDSAPELDFSWGCIDADLGADELDCGDGIDDDFTVTTITAVFGERRDERIPPVPVPEPGTLGLLGLGLLGMGVARRRRQMA